MWHIDFFSMSITPLVELARCTIWSYDVLTHWIMWRAVCMRPVEKLCGKTTGWDCSLRNSETQHSEHCIRSVNHQKEDSLSHSHASVRQRMKWSIRDTGSGLNHEQQRRPNIPGRGRGAPRTRRLYADARSEYLYVSHPAPLCTSKNEEERKEQRKQRQT